MFHHLTTRIVVFVVGLTPPDPHRRGDRPDRGDVPGWVLITLMTAGLVNSALNRQSVIKFLPPRIIAI